MATVPPAPPSGASPSETAGAAYTGPTQIVVYSRSTLFYWWPVWLLGLIFAAISFAGGHRMAILPAGTKVTGQFSEAKNKDGLPLNVTLTISAKDVETGKLSEVAIKELLGAVNNEAEAGKVLRPHVARFSGLGPVFFAVILLVIFVTSIHLRGLWSAIAVIVAVLVVVLLALFDLWDNILSALAGLHIFINAAGYLTFSVALLVLWLFIFLFWDTRRYVVFTPGQLRICEEVGDGEKTYDTTLLVVEKHQDDFFRHRLLGLGSGDLTIRTGGANPVTATMPNILFVSRRLKEIMEMIRTKPDRLGV